jgi:SAM-dependent methyltransferase
MTRFDRQYTSAFYDRYAERESARWKSGPRARMQHAIVAHHLNERVRAGDRVLDAGCGPGTFASVLVALGAHVHCLDISQVQLDMCRAAAPGIVGCELGSITDLSRFKDASFDCTLALGGAISYCFEHASVAVQELVRVTRAGGVVGLSAMNLLGSIRRSLPKVLATPLAANRRILETGDLQRDDTPDGHECHMFRSDELRELLTDGGLEEVELYANGWLVPDDDAEVPEEGTAAWQWLFAAELEASKESPAASTQIIAWAKVRE